MTAPPARLVVVDDEWVVGAHVAAALREAGHEVAPACTTAAEALALLDAAAADGRGVDCVVCDVYLGTGPTGLALCGELEARGVPYVLITGHDYREVVGGLGGLRPAGVVLKPIDERDLCCQVALALRGSGGGATLPVRHRGRRRAVPLASVRYLESANGDCVVHAPGRRYVHAGTLAATAERLPAGSFVRVHRRYVGNVRYVEGLRYGELALTGGERLPVGRRYYADAKAALGC